MIGWLLDLLTKKSKKATMLEDWRSWDRRENMQLVDFVPGQAVYKLDRKTSRELEASAYLGRCIRIFCEFEDDIMTLHPVEVDALEEGDVITVVYIKRGYE